MAGRGSGGGLGLALLIAAVLVGAGGWNYHRNYRAELEEQGQRPLQGYDDTGLAALADGYRNEIETLQLKHGAARRGRSGPVDRDFIGENVREFERVQAASRAERDLVTAIAQREARLREIEQEQRIRQQLASGALMVHLSRLVGI